MNTGFLVAFCAFVGVALSEAPGGWNGQSGLQSGPASSGQWGNAGSRQWDNNGNNQWSGQNRYQKGRSDWGQQNGGGNNWGQQQGGPDSRSLFGPDGKRYGANFIDTPEMYGYESNIPGATARYVGFRSAAGRSGQQGFGQNIQQERSGPAEAYGPPEWQRGGQAEQRSWSGKGGASQTGQAGWQQRGSTDQSQQGWAQ